MPANLDLSGAKVVCNTCPLGGLSFPSWLENGLRDGVDSRGPLAMTG